MFNQILTPGLSDEDRIALQDAAWFIFNQSSMNSVMNSKSAAYVADAIRYVSVTMVWRFAAVSSIDPVNNRQQELLISTVVTTPEPASIGSMGAGLTIAALFARSRRKSKKIN